MGLHRRFKPGGRHTNISGFQACAPGLTLAHIRTILRPY